MFSSLLRNSTNFSIGVMELISGYYPLSLFLATINPMFPFIVNSTIKIKEFNGNEIIQLCSKRQRNDMKFQLHRILSVGCTWPRGSVCHLLQKQTQIKGMFKSDLSKRQPHGGPHKPAPRSSKFVSSFPVDLFEGSALALSWSITTSTIDLAVRCFASGQFLVAQLQVVFVLFYWWARCFRLSIFCCFRNICTVVKVNEFYYEKRVINNQLNGFLSEIQFFLQIQIITNYLTLSIQKLSVTDKIEKKIQFNSKSHSPISFFSSFFELEFSIGEICGNAICD